MMATSMSSIVPPLPLDLATADLAGLGGHPSLDEYSPHEPMKIPDVQSSLYYDTQTQQQHFADSTDVFVSANNPRPLDVVEPSSNVISANTAETTNTTSVPEPTQSLFTSAAGPEENPQEKLAHEQQPLEREFRVKQVQNTAAQKQQPEEQQPEEQQPQEQYVQEQKLQEQLLEEQPTHDQEPQEKQVQEHSPQEKPHQEKLPQEHQLEELPQQEQLPQEKPPLEQSPQEQPPQEQPPQESSRVQASPEKQPPPIP